MNCRLRRLMSTLLVFAMLIGFIPPTMFNVAKAADGGEKSPIDKSTYEDLGFPMELEATSESYLNGNTGGKTTMNVKNELYLDYQAHKNYGWVLRDNLNFNHTSWTSYRGIGAYRLYGQYMDYGKTDDLDGKNGWTYGQTGGEGSLIGSGITSTGSHKSRAYKTAVEYRTASGKKDMVAQLYVTSGSNRTNWVAKLELLKYTKGSDGKYTPSVTSTVTLGASPALNESGMIFQQYFDALYDITAGDFDGDGIDEIAVYYGTNEVRIYDTGAYGTRLQYKQTIGTPDGVSEILKDSIDPSYISDSEGEYVHRAAIITLTAGDLKKDFSDDLVITVSMPQDNDNNAHLNNPHAYIYGLDTNKDSDTKGSLVKDEEIRLYVDNFQGDQDKPEQVFKAANATIGDIDGDACVELIIGGRLCDASPAGTDDLGWNWGALIPVEYDHGSKQYSVGTATQMKLDEYDEDDILIKAHCGDLRYSAPVGMAVADLDGVGSDAPRLFFFSELFTYNADTKSFEGTDMYLDTIKNQTNNVNESKSKGQHWVSDVVVGNFTNNDAGAEQIIAIVACKKSDNSSTDGDWYWYYMSYMAYGDIKATKNSDGSVSVEKGGFSAQCEGIINQGRSYINRTDKSRASTFVSIACPDVDNDSILLEHLDTETYYSKPEVQAVLQSAPYFADVAEVYDNYLNNGETAYGKLDASGQGVQASVSAKLGAYVDVEFQAGAAADLEAELAVTTSYEHASIDEVETEVSYSGAIGDDYVVMYTIPYIRYYYNATYPDGTTGLMKIEEPLTPATVIVPVETYDEIAATTEGLEPIRGNILTSTPGEPMTYLSAPKGDWHGIGSDQALTNAGSNSSSLVTVSQTSTSTKEHSFAVGIEENFKIGFGTGAVGNKVTAGITQGLSADAGGVYSNMKGVVYTGAVDNLPAGVTGYAFNWQFGISETKLNGEDIIVVGYKTSNVKQAPSITRNLAVTEVGSDYVELEWNKNNDAAMYELSISRDGNTWNLLKSIPATAAVGNTVRYRVTDLSDDTVFYFKVGASNAFGIRSLDSASVSAVTLAGENVSFEITSQPTNFSTHAGGNASFNVETKTNISSDIHYEWQYNDGDGWFKIGYDSPALTISNVTKAMDGRAVRCRVSQVANYMYSQVAYLEVSKSATETDLQIMNGSTEIKNADIVNASVIEYEPETTPITIWKEDDADGYLKMADKETVSDDGAHSYDGATFIWSKSETTGTGDDAQTVTKYYNKTVSDGNTSYEELTTFKNTFHKIAEDENIDVIKTASDTTTLDSAVEIEENTSSSGYLIDGTSDENPEYVYVVVETLDTGSTPDEDKANSTTKKTTYYVKEDESFIEVSLGDTIIVIGEEDYYISSFVPVMVAATDNIITGYTPVHSDGDELTFTATVDKGDQAAALAGSASFQLRNLATGLITTVPATKNDDGETFTATHTFTETGLFSVTAVYGGDASYFGSTSQPVVIYVSADSATLSITGGTITYGDSLELKPTLYKKNASGEKTGESVEVAYTVAKGEESYNDTIVDDVFTPTEAGNYVINASYTVGEGENAVTYTAIANVTVNKKTLTITANDATASISQSESERRNLLTCTIPEGVSVTPELSSDALTAVSQGDYTINVSIPAAERTALETKYSIVLVSGTYTLTQESVRVAVATGTNGSAVASYTTTVTDTNGTYTSSPLTVDNDSYIPKGATVTVTARPNSGFGVEKWTINGVIANDGNVSYTIENLDSEQNIYISFTHTLNTLSFKNEGNGTVTGVYAGTDNAPFASGNSINSTQTVILTATPAENNVISHWTKQVGNETETLKTEKGNNYTGATVEVSGVNAHTTYTAHFAKKEAKTVTIQFVDKADDHVLSTNVGVFSNGVIIEQAENKFTIETFVHDNLDIEIKIPDNMMVDHWKLGDEDYSNSTKSISLENIKDNMTFTVVCVAPTQRKLTFKAELLGTNGGELANAGTISAKRDGVEIDFTNDIATLPQGTVIDFTATASAGYRINKWTIDGTPATGADIGTLQTTLSANKEVIVYFEKLPTVSVTEHDPDNGSVEFVIDVATIQNPVSYVVNFGTKVQVNIKPVKGYVIGSVMVDNVVKALSTPSVVGGTDERYFELDAVNTNTNIEVTYVPLSTTDVTFGIVDKNGADTDGGLDGEIKASVNRNDIDSYKIENASSLEPVYEGSVVTFTATPAEGYKVSKWFLNGYEVEGESDLVIEGNTAKLAINKDMDDQDIKVQFDLIGEKVTYAIRSDASSSATLSATFKPNGSDHTNFPSGNIPTVDGIISITANNIPVGYEIAGWYVNGVQQMEGENAITSTTFNYNVVVGTGAEIEVVIIRSSYEVKFSAENGGTITATGPITSGDKIVGDTEVTFTATPDTGYRFDGWTVNGEASEETSNTLKLTITEDVEVIANYKLNEVLYNVTFGVVDGNGALKLNGSTNSPARVNANSDITFTAVPADDYQVEGWYSDAAGTQKIDGTTAEQNTYSINDVVEDKTVYVKFIQIPRYNINVQKSGNGTVTATVNGKAIEIPESGIIEVKNHDNVVLKATPDQYFGRDSWTVNGTGKGNAETLTLENVTEHTNVIVKFVTVEAIQLTTKVTNNGTIKVESGFGTDLEIREAGTGILIPKGHNIVVTATPGDNMMVKGWIINGNPITDPVKGIDHVFKLDNVSTNTVIEVEFEPLKTFTVPSGTAQYTIENIEETPVDLGGENAVRERGNVTFKVVPVSPNAITELEVSAGEGSKVETTKNADGTWTVTIEKVMANIVLNPTVVEGKPLIINCGEGGTVEVTLNGNAVTAGYAFKADDVITVKAKANSGYTLESLKLNDADFTSGKTYTVKADDNAIKIDATFKAAPAGGGGGGGFGGGGGGGASATYPPVIEETDNGKLIVTPEEPSKGDEVVITPVPDPGYMLDKIIVTDKNDEEIETEFNRDGTYSFEQPAGEVTIDAEFKKIVLPFEDVSDKAYYAEAVLWAVENGITTGVTPTLFMPDMVCTRAQAVTFLWRAAGSPAPKSADMHFTDVPENAYYYDAVIWALENGITTGTNDGSTFSPDMVCSRSQIVTLIARMEKAEKTEAENPFTDVKDTDYYYDSVLWAVDNYITNGTTETTFAPVKDCTRAEIVTFLWRAFR